jgi:hypothetical protein
MYSGYSLLHALLRLSADRAASDAGGVQFIVPRRPPQRDNDGGHDLTATTGGEFSKQRRASGRPTSPNRWPLKNRKGRWDGRRQNLADDGTGSAARVFELH